MRPIPTACVLCTGKDGEPYINKWLNQLNDEWGVDLCWPKETIQGGPKKPHTILLSISLLNIDRFS